MVLGKSKDGGPDQDKEGVREVDVNETQSGVPLLKGGGTVQSK